METKEFQKMCAGIVKEIDDKNGVKRDLYLGFMQLMEEAGELAQYLNSPKLRNKKIDQGSLEGGFADVIIQLASLADLYGVDLENAAEMKI